MEQSFEKIVEELKVVLGKLESHNLNLEDAVDSFEKGIKLIESAEKILTAAQKKLEILENDKIEFYEKQQK